MLRPLARRNPTDWRRAKRTCTVFRSYRPTRQPVTVLNALAQGSKCSLRSQAPPFTLLDHHRTTNCIRTFAVDNTLHSNFGGVLTRPLALGVPAAIPIRGGSAKCFRDDILSSFCPAGGTRERESTHSLRSSRLRGVQPLHIELYRPTTNN